LYYTVSIEGMRRGYIYRTLEALLVPRSLENRWFFMRSEVPYVRVHPELFVFHSPGTNQNIVFTYHWPVQCMTPVPGPCRLLQGFLDWIKVITKK
jgi:hypothetical protein